MRYVKRNEAQQAQLAGFPPMRERWLMSTTVSGAIAPAAARKSVGRFYSRAELLEQRGLFSFFRSRPPETGFKPASKVRNISSQPLKNVTAVASFYDANGGFITSSDAHVAPRLLH